ncbi:MAG: hypothetical protein K0041_08840 [Acidithiobacillus sp.]|nr:hypothetical protein [Acidithiobacillus sp.]
MNPATIQLLIQLIPVVTQLIQEIVKDVQEAQSSNTTEADLQALIKSTVALTQVTTTALQKTEAQAETPAPAAAS